MNALHLYLVLDGTLILPPADVGSLDGYPVLGYAEHHGERLSVVESREVIVGIVQSVFRDFIFSVSMFVILSMK